MEIQTNLYYLFCLECCLYCIIYYLITHPKPDTILNYIRTYSHVIRSDLKSRVGHYCVSVLSVKHMHDNPMHDNPNSYNVVCVLFVSKKL